MGRTDKSLDGTREARTRLVISVGKRLEPSVGRCEILNSYGTCACLTPL